VCGQMSCRKRRTGGRKVTDIGRELGRFHRGIRRCVVIEGGSVKIRGSATLGGTIVRENKFLNPPSSIKVGRLGGRKKMKVVDLINS
jgi:hypothetical protein